MLEAAFLLGCAVGVALSYLFFAVYVVPDWRKEIEICVLDAVVEERRRCDDCDAGSCEICHWRINGENDVAMCTLCSYKVEADSWHEAVEAGRLS